MKSKYKVGDRVFCKGNYHANIIEVKKDLFGIKYICKWGVNDRDYGISYKKVGIKRSWNIWFLE